MLNLIRDSKGSSTASVLDSVSDTGNAPIHLAALRGFVPVMEWLADNGANLMLPTGTPKANAGMGVTVSSTAQALAAAAGQLDAVRFLTINGASDPLLDGTRSKKRSGLLQHGGRVGRGREGAVKINPDRWAGAGRRVDPVRGRRMASSHTVLHPPSPPTCPMTGVSAAEARKQINSRTALYGLMPAPEQIDAVVRYVGPVPESGAD